MSISRRYFVTAAALVCCMAPLAANPPRHDSHSNSVEAQKTPASSLSRFAFDAPRIVLGSRLFAGVSTLTDLDADGFKDLVSGGTLFLEPGQKFSYVSLDEWAQGQGEVRFAGPSKNPLHVFPHVVSADLNEDHLDDLICVGRHGGLAIFIRTVGKAHPDVRGPQWGFEASHLLPSATDRKLMGGVSFRTRVIRTLDLDRDGHQDLLLAGDFVGLEGKKNYSDLLLLRGDGKGGLERPHHLLAGSVRSVQLADIDDDGLLDLVVLGVGGQVAVMIQKPLGGYNVQRLLLTSIPDAESLVVRDVDRDGIEDFVLMDPCVGGRCLDIAFYKGLSDGRPGAGRKLRLTLPKEHTVASVLLEDLDADGYPDIAVLCVDALGMMRLEIHAGDESSSWGRHESRHLSAILASELSVAPTGYLKFEDVDGDGARDLWVSPVRRQKAGKIGMLWMKGLREARPAVRRLGTSSAAGSGVVPRISVAGGPPRIGNPRFALRLSQVPGHHAPCWLWISHVRMDVRILGLQIKVFPFRTVMTQSEGGGPSGGLCRLPFPIPKDVSLVGESLYFQWVFPSAGAKNPLSLARSEALQVRFLPERDLSTLGSSH